ncbi:hypothetical protein VTO42DRAFT_2025 [Malbranchea cinnamomea]
MLATECARVLGYRDSYLLFNKNRSLHKIIASQAEKDDLIAQDILPYSYRSRQIAIVTARSMFRQFGSRVIVNGRRVRDDYWESKARKQGFTEEDLAGDKRPGGAKAREAATAATPGTANAGTLPALGRSDVVYSNEPHLEGGLPPHGLLSGFGHLPSTVAPLPMISPAPSDDPRMREYNSFPRPRQELAGQPYQDRTQPSAASEILNQASHTADFSKALNQQRGYRSRGLDDYWHRPRECDSSGTHGRPSSSHEMQSTVSAVPRTLQQDIGSAAVQSSTMTQNVIQSQHPITPQVTYAQSLHTQPSISQSPMRSIVQTIRPDQLHHRTPSMTLSTGGGTTYGYTQGQQQLWGQPPPQPSSLANSQHLSMPQQIHAQQQSPSPHLQHTPPPHLPSRSPRHQSHAAASPQLQAQQNVASVGYPSAAPVAYPALSGARGMYSASPGPGGNQFLAGNPSQQVSIGIGMATNAALPGWLSTAGGSLQPGQPPAGSPQGGWPNNY